MKKPISHLIRGVALVIALFPWLSMTARARELCLDGFCVGQSIKDGHFDDVAWIVPKDALEKEPCREIGCQPDVAFRGYSSEIQQELADALRLVYGIGSYNVIRRQSIDALRHYAYECNPSPRGIFGERRFFGVFRSSPSQYLTVVGLRLIGGELRVYRIAREFPYHNQYEIVSLAKTTYQTYGQTILLYDYLSSNAYTDVIKRSKSGWFARSSMFNPTDMTDNKAELVLIDPTTRPLLEPSSMPESGEIKPLPARVPDRCSRSMPLQ